MVKKGKKITQKKTTKKKRKSTPRRSSQNNNEKILVENFVALQKVITNLSIKFDHLSNQLSQMINLFEISAKALAKKDFDIGKDDQKMLEKLDKLADQNRTIARGIALLHENEDQEKINPPLPNTNVNPLFNNKINPPLPNTNVNPLPSMPKNPSEEVGLKNNQQYQKSISSEQDEYLNRGV